MKNLSKDCPTCSPPDHQLPVQVVKSHWLAPRLLAGWVVACSDLITSDALLEVDLLRGNHGNKCIYAYMEGSVETEQPCEEQGVEDKEDDDACNV